MSALVRRRPRSLLLGAALTGAAVLTGCGTQEVTGEAAEVSIAPAADTAAAPSGAPSGALADVADLSAGLLPADALGAGDVRTLTAEELAQQLQRYGGSLAGSLAGLSIAPESCGAALSALQGMAPQPGDVDGFAAQVAKDEGTGVLTAEVLGTGPAAADAVAQLVAGVTACPEVTLGVPQLGSATLAFQTLGTPGLGDDAAVVSVSTIVTPAGRAPISTPVLLGAVQDGDRLVTLLSTGPDAELDAGAFDALLAQAVQHAADELD